MHSQQTWNHQLRPAPTAIKTQPLSKCVLLVCAYQRTRQRNIGMANKKTCEGFWQLFGKGRMFGRPFFKTNPQELSTLCIYPKQLLNKTKNVSINKTLSSSTLAHDFYPTTLEEHPINNYDPDRVLFGNHAMERKCINSYTLDLGVRWYQKASS